MHKIDFESLDEIVVIDFETTGLDPDEDRIVSVSALHANIEETENVVKDQFNFVVNPTINIPEEASRIHGIWTKDVQNEPTFAEMAEKLMEFIGDRPVVGYNIQFDWNFINAELKRCGLETLEGRDYFCTMTVLHDSWGYRPTLKHAIARFGLTVDWDKENENPDVNVQMSDFGRAHDAYYDTMGTAYIAAYIRNYTPQQIKESGDMWSGSAKINDPPSNKQMAFLKKLGGNPDLVYTKKDASRYIDLLKVGRGHEFASKVKAVHVT